MIKIFLTGSTGFLGKNFIDFFSNKYFIFKYDRTLKLNILGDVVINFAGKAHDLKNVSSEEEYYKANSFFVEDIFNSFLLSNAKVFITISSVKAIADEIEGELLENTLPNPITHYGKSKLLAEQYILTKSIPKGKRVYILRPCMIHGPGNKGNLNLLFNVVSKGMHWPLGLFENSRSYLSIENLFFIIEALINKDDIPSGIYNVADDDPISTNELIRLIAASQNKSAVIWNIPRRFIVSIAKFGDKFNLPFNLDRLQKLTSSYVVSNVRIKNAIGEQLPITSRDGLLKTFKSFNK